MAVSKRLRYEVLRRDNHVCRYCGAAAPDAKLTVDHVIPTALGGSDEPGNLVAACVDCNSGKSSSNPDAPLVDDVTDAALRWGRAVAQAADAMTTRLEADRDTQERFLTVWTRWTYGPEDDRKNIPLDPNWKDSLSALLKRGLPLKVINECVDIAMRRDAVHVDNKFKYFCGVAWRKVDELTEDAKSIYDRESTSDAVAEPDLYRSAVLWLYGVLPWFDQEEHRESIAARFEQLHVDDDEHPSWTPELKSFLGQVEWMSDVVLNHFKRHVDCEVAP